MCTGPADASDGGAGAFARLIILDEDVDDDEGAVEGEVEEAEDVGEDAGVVEEGEGDGDHVVSEDDGEVDIPSFLGPFLRLMESVPFRLRQLPSSLHKGIVYLRSPRR